MLTFTWTPEWGAERDLKPNVTQVRMGDGYEQRFATGLNTKPAIWSVSFANREPAEAAAIDSFLLARGGVESFLWTPPGESAPIVVVVRQWRKSPQKGGRYSFTFSMEQVFEA